MKDPAAETVYVGIANGWITACYKLIARVSLEGVSLVGIEPRYDEDLEEAKNERKIMVQVDFLDDQMTIGKIVLTRVDQSRTLIEVSRDPLPDNRLIMYDLRGKNGNIKKRFEKIRETVPVTLAAVVDAIEKKLRSLDLLEA